MILIKVFALIKVCIFALPYGFYKATHHDSTSFKDFVNTHTEEVTGGTFAGMTGVYEIFMISKAELHDLYIGVLKALLMSVVGYYGAALIKKAVTWIQKKLK